MAMNGLDKITEKILAEAEAEAGRILSEAEAEAGRIRAAYAEKADAIRARVATDAEREGTELVARAKNADAVARRNAILRVRGELVDETFSLTLAAVRSMRAEQYAELLSGLLAAALLEQIEAEESARELYGEEDATAPECYEVLLSASDREKYGEALISSVRTRLSAKVGAGKLDRLVLSRDVAAIDGGLILRYGDIESNCSLELLFAGLRRELEGEVGHVLFDPKERN